MNTVKIAKMTKKAESNIQFGKNLQRDFERLKQIQLDDIPLCGETPPEGDEGKRKFKVNEQNMKKLSSNKLLTQIEQIKKLHKEVSLKKGSSKKLLAVRKNSIYPESIMEATSPL